MNPAAPEAAMPDAAVPGTLYLVPTPLDFGCTPQPDVREALPASTLATAAGLPVLVAEDPLTCVVRGCGMALERMERLGSIFTSE